MRIPIIFSTVTGNAYKLAQAAVEVVPDSIGPYNIRYITNCCGKRSINFVTDEIIKNFDTLILCYWCDLGGADEDTTELITGLKDKNLILLGTLGAPVDGEHAGKVRERIAKLASENNRLILHYLCRGSIDLYRTENKRKIPEGQKGRIDEKGYLRHLDSQGHPNADELNGAKRAVTEALLKL